MSRTRPHKRFKDGKPALAQETQKRRADFIGSGGHRHVRASNGGKTIAEIMAECKVDYG